MDIAVNWSALDALVLDYAEAEGLLHTPASLSSCSTSCDSLSYSSSSPSLSSCCCSSSCSSLSSSSSASSSSSLSSSSSPPPPPPPPPSSSSSSLIQSHLRRKVDGVRKLILGGHLTEALDVLKECAPLALQDRCLLFRLYKQKFLELLRTGTEDGRIEAIEFSRTQLGPCALDAYPEAYQEFKWILLALIYGKDDQASPIAEEWSEAKRADLAASVTSLLTAQLHAYDHIFSLALRYLVSTHNNYYLHKGELSPIAQFAAKLLSKTRDPAWTAHELLLEAPKFNEGNVQALAHAVDISRQEAVDSLRCTGGDVFTALKNELNRMRLDISLLDEFVREYCVYRGLIQGGFHKLPLPRLESCTLTIATNDGRISSSEKNEILGASTSNADIVTESQIEPEVTSNLNQGYSVITIHESSVEDLLLSSKINEEGSAGVHLGEEVISKSSASESVSRVDKNAPKVQKARTSGRKKERSFVALRKWKGRSGNFEGVTDTTNLEVVEASIDQKEIRESEVFAVEEKYPQQIEFESYAFTREIKELTSKGLMNEAIEEIQYFSPSFFDQNPELLFSMKQTEFLKLVEDGKYKHAVALAQSSLGPLSLKHPDLLKPLKETIMVLAHPQGEVPLMKPTPISMLAASLQVALEASLGITEPLLMKIMRTLIFCHTEWFKLQMCSDSFADMLSITALKETNSTTGTIVSSGGGGSVCSCSEGSSTVSSHTERSQSVGNASSVQGSEDSSHNAPRFNEGSILTVMEWMALSRGDAIQLLAQNNGNVENVLTYLLP